MEKYIEHLDLLVPKTLEDLEADLVESFIDSEAHRIPKLNCDNAFIDVCAKSHLIVEESKLSEVKSLCQQMEQVIVLDGRIEAPKTEYDLMSALQSQSIMYSKCRVYLTELNEVLSKKILVTIFLNLQYLFLRCYV